MAVTLALDYTERNDNKLLTLTDTSTGWGSPAGSDITTLTLDVSVTISDGTETTYDQINLVTLNSITGSTTQAELIFNIDPTNFLISGDPGFATDAVFPDGIYHFIYTLNTTDSILDEYVLIEGNVRNAVYFKLRNIPTLYMCKDCRSKEIMDAIFAYGYLNSMRAGGYVAKTEELINQLYVLERLLEYGSSYTW
jgi:hypothetical protein